MRFLLFSAFAATAFAANVSVLWHHEKSSGNTSLTVHAAEDDTILAQTCGSSLGSLDFSKVEENGSGHFTIGNNTFPIRFQPNNTGGVSCTRKFNGDVALAECSGLSFDIPEDAPRSADCFSHEETTVFLHAIHPRKVVLEDAPSNIEQRTPAKSYSLFGRQICHSEDVTIKEGNGNPHQNFYLKQLSGVINCGAAPSCTAGENESKSFGIGFSFLVTPVQWITGGFNVQMSWTTGSSYSCTGGKGEDVCIWYNTAHTAYTVRNYYRDTCYGDKGKSKPFVLYSPNQNNRGGGMYCVIGTCRAQGDAYWDKSGRAGGP